jgi:hypothetical protein
MNIKSIIEKANKSRYVILSENELKSLLSSSNILQEKETHISDKIRLIKLKDKILIQEKTDKDEFLVRLMKTKKEAEDLINDRLEVYEKMWDGCGCKVEYYI